MSAANLRLAAQTMRREEELVWDAVADLLDSVAVDLAECQRLDSLERLSVRLEQPYYALPLAVAAAYLATGETADRPERTPA